MTDRFALEFETDQPPESTLVVAFPEPGLAGLSANQYLIETLDLTEVGYIQTRGLPAITPYANGRPHHPARLFSGPGFDYTVLTCEVPIPAQFAGPFGRRLAEWLEHHAVEEMTLLTTVPHLEFSQGLYHVASRDYAEKRLGDETTTPLSGGFLTGVNATLVDQAIETNFRAGILATGGNPYVPVDGEATLRLVEGFADLYDIEVDTDTLKKFAEESSQYHRELSAQIEAHQSQSQRPLTDNYGFM